MISHSGCSTKVEHTPHDPEFVGLIPTEYWAFSVNDVIEQLMFICPSFLFPTNFIINANV